MGEALTLGGRAAISGHHLVLDLDLDLDLDLALRRVKHVL